MKLKEWLSIRGNTAAKLAQRAGIDPPIISKLKSGRTTTLRIAVMLDRASGGEIRAEDNVTDPADAELIAYIRGGTK